MRVFVLLNKVIEEYRITAFYHIIHVLDPWEVYQNCLQAERNPLKYRSRKHPYLESGLSKQMIEIAILDYGDILSIRQRR